ncbi:MAG: glycoside hydrolase family 3 protein [Clostridiales bacterium]|jgi:beta-N-acetylhexosaminidase|nr:glycoside hydrolase family 3 protein [Clostridiales bacterium]
MRQKSCRLWKEFYERRLQGKQADFCRFPVAKPCKPSMKKYLWAIAAATLFFGSYTALSAEVSDEIVTPNKLTINWLNSSRPRTTIDTFRIRGYNVAQLRTLVGACGGAIAQLKDQTYQIEKSDENKVDFVPISFSGTTSVKTQFNVTPIRDVRGRLITPNQPGWVYLTSYQYNWGSLRDILRALDLEIAAYTDNPASAKTSVVIAPAGASSDPMTAYIASMTLEEKIGQLFNVRANESDLDVVSRLRLGGVTLFAENMRTPSQTKSLCQKYQSKAEIPLIIAVDEEGGRVSRLNNMNGNKAYKSASEIGKTKDPSKAEASAERAGKELLSLGINMDFAPVADIWSNSANTVIGDRAYGTTAAEVSPMVKAAVKGFHNAGILSSIKHFPGHGDTAEDSHMERAVYNHDLDRLKSSELKPFQAGIDAGADAVMVGHIAAPKITGNNMPADMLPFFMKDILRDEMGFDGLIITDALDMGGVAQEFGSGEAAVKAFLAGADILLLPKDVDAAFKAVENACKDGRISEDRLNESVKRILLKKEKLGWSIKN